MYKLIFMQNQIDVMFLGKEIYKIDNLNYKFRYLYLIQNETLDYHIFTNECNKCKIIYKEVM